MQADGNGQQPEPRNKLMFRFFGNGEERIRRENIQECFYMTHIDNLPSILQNGLLSHRRIEKLNPARKDLSNQAVQARRGTKVIERVDPNKRPRSLHRFVNLYLNPHNAMMMNVIFGREGFPAQDRQNMCILRIRGEILDRSDAILTDQNAATNSVDFFTVDAFELDQRRTMAITYEDVTGYKPLKSTGLFRGMTDEEISSFKKQTRQAEALLPYKVDARYIFGIWVCDQATCERVGAILQERERDDVRVAVNNQLFLPKQYQPLRNYVARDPDAEMDDFEVIEQLSSDESDDEGAANAIILRRSGV